MDEPLPPPLSPNEDVKTKERKVMASETAQLDGKDETDEDEYDEDGLNDDSAQSSTDGKEGKGDELSRLRREKRLAMNRESARERRKRKKVLLETLEERVEQLAEQNRRYQLVNENLTAKVKRLEADLGFARSTITMLSNQNASNTGASAVHSSGVVPGPVPVGTIGGHQEALRRLVESQKMIQRDNSSLLIDSLINHRLSQQQVSDLQALQQANREMAWISTLGSLKQSGGMKASQGSLNLQQQNMGAKYLSDLTSTIATQQGIPASSIMDVLARSAHNHGANSGTPSKVVCEPFKSGLKRKSPPQNWKCT